MRLRYFSIAAARHVSFLFSSNLMSEMFGMVAVLENGLEPNGKLRSSCHGTRVVLSVPGVHPDAGECVCCIQRFMVCFGDRVARGIANRSWVYSLDCPSD